MKTQLRIALALTAVALLVPATAIAVPGNGKGSGGPEYNPVSPPVPPAKAYGKLCQGESKEHVKGVPGTDFSRCVKNMAQAAKNPELTPSATCKGESKKHVKGEKGTAFSRCKKAAAKLRQQERKEAAAQV